MSHNAVNSVVANLIRAAAGSSAKNVSDQDVDKYVADLILKEAQEKRTKYDKVGVEAYQPNGLIKKPKPKPNTRFLLNVVKATDSHNQFVIKANEDNVAKLREERLQREREERERLRSREHRSSRDNRRSSKDDRRSSKDDRRSSKDDRRSSTEHKHSNRERSSRDHKHSSYKSSSRRDDKKHDRGDTPKNLSNDHHSAERQEDSSSVQYKGRGKVRINVSSMDKYFSKGYDPLLDVDSDKEEYVGTKRKRKERRKHKSEKKDHKKKKHYSSSSSSSSSSSEEEEKQIKQVRAWDVGKV